MNLAKDKIKAMGNLLPIPFLMPLNLTSALSYFPTLQVHHCLINLTLISMRAGTISVLFIYALINHLKGSATQNIPLLKIPLHSILHRISLSAASPKSSKQNAPYTVEVNTVGANYI